MRIRPDGTTELTIAFDVDDVVADLLPEWMRLYSTQSGHLLFASDVDRWELNELVVPEWREEIFSLLTPEMYDNVWPIPGALAAVKVLRSLKHRVIFASSCVVGTADAKANWLVRNGFLSPAAKWKDFMAVSDKTLVRADILFDDRPLNVETFPADNLPADLVRLPAEKPGSK